MVIRKTKQALRSISRWSAFSLVAFTAALLYFTIVAAFTGESGPPPGRSSLIAQGSSSSIIFFDKIASAGQREETTVSTHALPMELAVIVALTLAFGLLLRGRTNTASPDAGPDKKTAEETKFAQPVSPPTSFKRSKDKLLNHMVDKLLLSRNQSLDFIQHIIGGDLDFKAAFTHPDELSQALHAMREKLLIVSVTEKQTIWLNENLAAFEHVLKVESGTDKLYQKLMSFITKKAGTCVGAIYLYESQNGEEIFRREASFGHESCHHRGEVVAAGQGQLGQVAFDKKTVHLQNVRSKYLSIESALGESPATQVVIVPLLFKDTLYGAVELGGFTPITPITIKWLERAGESLAAYLFNLRITVDAKNRLEELAQRRADELVQIHALQRETNNRLQAKLQEAEDERRKNEAILQGCVDGVLSFNAEGKILFSNRTMQEMLCLTKDELESCNLYDLLPIKTLKTGERLHPYYCGAQSDKEIQIRTEASFPLRNGDTVDVLITATEVSVNSDVFFTFFIQKISIDLF